MSTEEKLAAAAALKDKGNAAFKAGAGRGCRLQAGQALRRRRCACACPTGRGTCDPAILVQPSRPPLLPAPQAGQYQRAVKKYDAALQCIE